MKNKIIFLIVSSVYIFLGFLFLFPINVGANYLAKKEIVGQVACDVPIKCDSGWGDGWSGNPCSSSFGSTVGYLCRSNIPGSVILQSGSGRFYLPGCGANNGTYYLSRDNSFFNGTGNPVARYMCASLGSGQSVGGGGIFEDPYGYVAPSAGLYGGSLAYSCPSGGVLSGTTCITDNGCAANTCNNTQCWNNLAWVQGTKICADNSCAANTCTDSVCWNNLAWISGTKLCDNGCAANTCNTTQCWNSYQWVQGTKICADNSCAANTCTDSVCWNNLAWIPGIKAPTYSNYFCNKVDSLDCSDQSNCGKQDNVTASCTAINSCNGQTESRPLAECGVSCVSSSNMCPVCPVKKVDEWKEVTP
jgi:hypothetical protein